MATTAERVQTGIRIEKRTLKVLKALAEYLDLSLGDLLERIVLHAFEGRASFGAEVLAQIARLKEVYGLKRGAHDRRSVPNAARSALGATRRQASSRRSRSSAARTRERRTSTHS